MTTKVQRARRERVDEAPATYGLIAEFERPEELLAATQRAYAEGYRKMDAYSPMPIEGLSDALGFHHTRLPLVVLICGLGGAALGFLFVTWTAVVDYPLNIGGRPLFSWPAFIPITFEMGILLAAFGAVFGMIVMNGLPMPYHPVFNAPGFERASQDAFFLCIEAADPKYNPDQTRAFLQSLGPRAVSEVEN